MTTSRRTFLKAGAMAAAPVAALAPASVLAADDGTRARLALLEDEKAIRQAMRPHLAGITPDPAAEPDIALGADGTTATYRRACMVEASSAFAGNTTVEKMARFQGQQGIVTATPGTIEASLHRTASGWQVTGVAMA